LIISLIFFFRDFQREFKGRLQKPARWKSCTSAATILLDKAVGSLYVRQYFSPKDRDAALEMVKNLKMAFKSLLDKNSWMDKETVVALEKVCVSKSCWNIWWIFMFFTAERHYWFSLILRPCIERCWNWRILQKCNIWTIFSNNHNILIFLFPY